MSDAEREPLTPAAEEPAGPGAQPAASTAASAAGPVPIAAPAAAPAPVILSPPAESARGTVLSVAPAPSGPPVEPAPPAPPKESTAAGAFVAVYEHPSVVRFCHWLNAIVLTVMVMSGWRIFIAFPSFGPRVPEKVFLNIPESITLGGWLGGALQWHLTFAWAFVATGAVYVLYLIASGQYKTMLFRARDIPGVWPMVRHYFFFGPAPGQTEAYNPLQKLAYTTIIVCGALSVLTGLVILRPVQFSPLTRLMGGFHLARVWHFIAMCGFVAFIPGHLLMVALHGWNNFMSMVSGWKKNPEYLRR
jgi:Ni/Fe-hydrogenase b-type cytochrome subunit